MVDETGLSVFEALRHRLRDHAAILCAFDLIELDGKDIRWACLEDRKHALTDLFSGTFDGDGEIIFRHAGCEGIVSKRLGSAYRHGRVNRWLKIKNPAAPPVKREVEEIGAAWANGCDDVAPLLVALGYRRAQPKLLRRPRQQWSGVGSRVFRDRARKADGCELAHTR